MNKSIVLYILGWVLVFQAAFMVLPVIVALIYAEKSGLSFLLTIAICLMIGIPLIIKKPKSRVFLPKKDFWLLP